MELRRTLGTRDITFFVIACIVGTRWLATAAHAGPGSILLWLIAAVCFAVPLAIATAALTIRHPHAGGMYVWTRHDFGTWHGFLCFWLYWMGTIVWFPGAAMFYTGSAAGIAGPIGTHLAENRIWLLTASLALIWIALGANIFGVKSGQRIADLGAAASWLLALLFGIAAFAFGRHHAPATAFHLRPEFNWDTVSLLSVIAFAMTGMEVVGLMGAEIRDPKRTLPRAAWISSIFATIYYAGATAAILVLLRPDRVGELQGLTQAGNATALALGMPWLPPVIALLVFTTAMGQFGGLGSSNARLPFAAGVHGLMPRAFGKIHPRWNTPHISILLLGVIASTLLLVMQIGDTARAAYDTVVSRNVIVSFFPFVYVFASSWKTGHRWSAASGMAITLIAILASVVPPGGITNVWIFEGKLALGTVASVASAWFVYRRQFTVAARQPVHRMS
jgi:amino acid transporter